MKLSSKGLALIKEFEGLELNAYKDSVGVATIGYGHTVGVKMGDRITEYAAECLLIADVRIYEDGVNKALFEGRVVPTQGQFDALVSFAFNLGLGNLRKSTLLRDFLAHNIPKAADEFLRWNRAGGKILAGLTRRREAERLLFLS